MFPFFCFLVVFFLVMMKYVKRNEFRKKMQNMTMTWMSFISTCRGSIVTSD